MLMSFSFSAAVLVLDTVDSDPLGLLRVSACEGVRGREEVMRDGALGW